MNDFKVVITWTAVDVQALHPDWTLEKCEDVLFDISERLETRCIELGWELIEDLIDMQQDEVA